MDVDGYALHFKLQSTIWTNAEVMPIALMTGVVNVMPEHCASSLCCLTLNTFAQDKFLLSLARRSPGVLHPLDCPIHPVKSLFLESFCSTSVTQGCLLLNLPNDSSN